MSEAPIKFGTRFSDQPSAQEELGLGLIEVNIESILSELGEDTEREGLVKTPARYARAMMDLTSGIHQRVEDFLNEALFDSPADQMVLVKDIEMYSLCEHHLLPFFGKVHVGYIPNGKVIGLSKIPRIVDMFSRRLQIQENLTHQIAMCLEEILHPKGIAVVCQAKHFCMMMRGVEKQHSNATTSAMLGAFRDSAEARAEFLSLIRES